MQETASFADLLERELERQVTEAPDAPVPTPTPWVAPFPTPAPLLAASRLTVRPTSTTPFGRPIAPTLGEQRAFVALESVSDRPADFTATELRTAFRQLARRYHPDRHPAATAAESTQLSRAFATVEANYRRFLPATASAR